jgi:hypothetical protein
MPSTYHRCVTPPAALVGDPDNWKTPRPNAEVAKDAKLRQDVFAAFAPARRRSLNPVERRLGRCVQRAARGWSDTLPDKEDSMFLVRDIMYCKPGQARPMVQKFLALGKLGQNMGFGSMRVMTDVSAERYWTVVTEMEVESLEKYAETTRKSMELKEFQEAMKGYHDLVDHGRREIYSIEK